MKVKELLDSPDKWIKGSFARGANGAPVPPRDPDACTFCILGALERCYSEGAGKNAVYFKMKAKVLAAIETVYPHKFDGIYSFNDSENTTFHQVKKVLRVANV